MNRLCGGGVSTWSIVLGALILAIFAGVLTLLIVKGQRGAAVEMASVIPASVVYYLFARRGKACC